VFLGAFEELLQPVGGDLGIIIEKQQKFTLGRLGALIAGRGKTQVIVVQNNPDLPDSCKPCKNSGVPSVEPLSTTMI
jgi:hypothetical protein